MRSRNRLDVAKLEEFLSFLESDGWQQEPVKSEWEAARVRRGKMISIIWKRAANHAGTPLTHLTLDRIGNVLFDIWVKERRK